MSSLTSSCGFCKKAVFCFYSSNVYWKVPKISLLLLSWLFDSPVLRKTYGMVCDAVFDIDGVCTVHRNQLCEWTNKMHFLYIYLFYNFHIQSTCFERSSRSSSGVNRSVLHNTHSPVQSCKCVQIPMGRNRCFHSSLQYSHNFVRSTLNSRRSWWSVATYVIKIFLLVTQIWWLPIAYAFVYYNLVNFLIWIVSSSPFNVHRLLSVYNNWPHMSAFYCDHHQNSSKVWGTESNVTSHPK